MPSSRRIRSTGNSISQLTFALSYAFHRNFVLPSRQDEAVHLKRSCSTRSGRLWEFANRLLLRLHVRPPGKKLLFMGEEFASGGSEPRQVALLGSAAWDTPRECSVRPRPEPPYRTRRAHEVDSAPKGSSGSTSGRRQQRSSPFLRRGRIRRRRRLVFNFTPPREKYRVGVPWPRAIREALNSDAAATAEQRRERRRHRGGERSVDGSPHSVSLMLHRWSARFLPARAINHFKIRATYNRSGTGLSSSGELQLRYARCFRPARFGPLDANPCLAPYGRPASGHVAPWGTPPQYNGGHCVGPPLALRPVTVL